MIAQIEKKFISLSIKKTFTRLITYFFYEGRPLTTKGRWFNLFVFFLFRLQEVLPTYKKIYKPIFILGTGRSGTTILGVTLGIHNDIGFLNEPKAFWSYLCDSDDLIGSYHKKNGKYKLDELDATDKVISKAHAIYGNYLTYTLSSRIVDKYPEMIFRVPYIKQIFPDAKFLFLYRNGWDTCHSIKLWSERLGISLNDGKTHDWWGEDNRKWKLLCEQVVAFDEELSPYLEEIITFNNHMYMAAVEWIVTMKQGMSMSSDKSVMPVKYEDYVSLKSFRDKVLEFCELSNDDNYTLYCESVLKAPRIKPPIELPNIIYDEFIRVMKDLGY